MIIQRTAYRFFQYFLDFIIQISIFFSLVLCCNLASRVTIEQVFILLIQVIVWFYSAYAYGVYDEFRSRGFTYEIISILKASVTQLLTLVILFFFIIDSNLSRVFVFLYPVSLAVVIILYRFVLRKFLDNLRIKGRNLRNVVIIGAGQVGLNFHDTIKSNPHFGYRVLGFLDDSINPSLNGNYLGPIENIEQILSVNHIDEVIIALPNYATEKIEQVINACNNFTTRVKIIPDYFRFISERFEVSTFGNFPIISVRNDKINLLHWRLIKRIFDIGFSLFVIIFILSWLFPFIALLIKIDSRGPVLFKQERWGRDNKKFNTYKFRSMYLNHCDSIYKNDFIQAKKDDPRITRVGKILRKTNLDELPQFFNVIKGEMSVVGPRPHPTPLNLESKNRVRYYMLRHLVKPGITGWAQVNGYRGETDTIDKMQKRVEYDLWYIENWSIWLDIHIIILTIWNMIKGDDNAY